MTPGSAPREGQLLVLVRRALAGRITARRAAGVISLITLILTLAGGIAIWLVDKDSFPSLGAGLWWAVQTLTTVGYGDFVPDDTIGRIIGTVVMLNGIALLTVITAAVTATLVEQMRVRESGDGPAASGGGDVAGKLERISDRLDAIERKLDRQNEP